MLRLVRSSLLIQLLSVYLVFVIVVLSGGVVIDAVIEQHLTSDVQASDQALAQEIALRTSLRFNEARQALVELGKIVAAHSSSPETLEELFQVFKASHNNVDQVYWLDEVGVVRLSWPQGKVGVGTEFSPPGVVAQALRATDTVFEIGIATATTTRNAGVIIAQPVRNQQGNLLGIVADSVSLVELSLPLQTIVQAQQVSGRHLVIGILDDTGKLIATSQPQRILQTVIDELPGAEQALQGDTTSRLAVGSDGQSWLFSALPVPGVKWAVVIERPTSEALAVVSEFRLWLLPAALLFALGGLLFWLLLLVRVIRPLHTLALQHQALPTSPQSLEKTTLPTRQDEVGNLARSLILLEQDGLKKLAELQTLLETSNAVVRSFEPQAVVKKIIREVRRLVDVQAAAVLLPDEQGVLRVLVSDGHNEYYDRMLALSPENLNSAPVLALRDGKPVQKILDHQQAALSYTEGFRSVLAIPIISRHAGAVVLLVHRNTPQPFDQKEIDLLLTFANYATLAWEHAVLYERSDERLREVAKENERLYRQSSEEKQKLAAIMGSMSDGLVLTGSDGTILYANQGASRISGLPYSKLYHQAIEVLYNALSNLAVDDKNCEQIATLAGSKEASEQTVEINRERQHQSINLRLFEVGDEAGQVIGRGLLLRDVTRERDLDKFRTTLLAAVGHELRTPLAVIKGHASTLLQKDVSWPVAEQHHFLQSISAEVDRLTRLVSNLLDLSRQEAGLLLLNQEPLRIQDLIATTVEHHNHPTASLEVDLPTDLPLVNADKARTEVVLDNLIANALAYGEGSVRIWAEQRNQVLIVGVWDNGPGIAAEELPHIFERFYRARRGHQRHTGGTGLGLAICKAFVEAHGGVIWAESSPDRGTTILFSLPLVSPTEACTLDETPLIPVLTKDIAKRQGR